MTRFLRRLPSIERVLTIISSSHANQTIAYYLEKLYTGQRLLWEVVVVFAHHHTVFRRGKCPPHVNCI